MHMEHKVLGHWVVHIGLWVVHLFWANLEQESEQPINQ